MNWKRVLLGGVAAGLAINVADVVMHGMIMGPTYVRYPEVFAQQQANPLWFTAIGLCIGIAAALLFGRTRASWGPGVKGGAVYGVFLGLVGFFPDFYDALVFDGFPYFLVWCWGGITMIDSVIAGAVLGAIVKAD